MSDSPSQQTKILALPYATQLHGHYEMAQRIESLSSKEDFIKAIAREGFTGLKAALAGIMENHGDPSWETTILRMETEKARLYPKVIVNQTLVLMCTTLDTYLQTSMEVILKSDSAALLSLCYDKDITVHEIIKFGVGDGAISQVRTKILDRFDHKGIEKKIKLLKKCGLNMDKILGGSSRLDKISPQQGRKLLFDIYQNRHDIVHKGALPIANSAALHDCFSYFSSFIFRFAEICNEDKGIPSDVTDFFRSNVSRS